SKDRIVLFLVFALVFLALQASLPEKAHAQSNFYVASLNHDIDPGAEDFVISSINDATSSGIHNFILILNTNGGSGTNMENIISAISNYEGAGNTFYTLVAPASAHAFSAGAYIAEASNNITMIPGTLIGSATPIVSGIPTGEENTTLTKDINAFTTYMVALTKHNGRNWNATALMVTKGVSYECGTVTSCTALQQGVIDTVLPANNTQQALTMMRAGDAPRLRSNCWRDNLHSRLPVNLQPSILSSSASRRPLGHVLSGDCSNIYSSWIGWRWRRPGKHLPV